MIRDKTFLYPGTGEINLSVLTAIAILFLFMLISCDNEPSIIGEDLQPPSEKLIVTHLDTISLNAYTFTQDSILSSGFLTALVGEIHDSVFGSSRASFLTRIRLSGTDLDPMAFSPGKSAVADSLILYILPDSYYGDVNTKMRLKVYRLAEDILRDSIYYSSHNPVYDLNSEQIFTIAVNDTLLRMKLDTSFFGTPLSEIDTIETNAELRQYFKGIYVAFDSNVSGAGAIFLLDLLSLDSRLIFHYHDINNDTIPLDYTFNINSYSARANLFSHDYSTGTIAHLDSLTEDTLIYVQGMGGTYAKIDFPFLEDIRNLGPMALNKAEIIFRMWEYCDGTIFTRPEDLNLVKKNDEGTFVTLFDEVLGEEYFGGQLDTEEGTYTFNITNHISDFIVGKTEDPAVYLILRDQKTSPERVAIFNSTSPNNIGFRLIFTELQ